jgi:2-iminobutanoate/2-iminopropanoate deaminase
MKIIQTDKAPKAVGPYSQAIISNNFLFGSGQIPINPENSLIEAIGIEAQTEQVIKNIGEVLKASGLGFKNVIKTSCFLDDMDDFGAFNAVYEKYFVSKPARACVEVSKLPKGVLVEIEFIAEL